jgi:hypothetical protein
MTLRRGRAILIASRARWLCDTLLSNIQIGWQFLFADTQRYFTVDRGFLITVPNSLSDARIPNH